MSRYVASVVWENTGPDFGNNEYSRSHLWKFDGGCVVSASAAPDIVPSPWSVPEFVDPEEAFLASLASCHMLFFLHIASTQGFLLDSYTDNAEGIMEKNNDGKLAITKIYLHPRPVFDGENLPDKDVIDSIHQLAHAECFIANSVKSEIIID